MVKVRRILAEVAKTHWALKFREDLQLAEEVVSFLENGDVGEQEAFLQALVVLMSVESEWDYLLG